MTKVDNIFISPKKNQKNSSILVIFVEYNRKTKQDDKRKK